MSSIRPLFTITVLAAAGVFLYMKINETEPVLPEEVADIDFGGGLEFDTQFETPAGLSSDAGAFDPAAAGGTAPSFTAAAPTESAPPFNPDTVAEASAAPVFVPGEAAASVVAEATSPVVPAVPSVPPVAQSTVGEPAISEPVAETVVTENTTPPATLPTESTVVETQPVVTTPVEAVPTVTTSQPEAATTAQASLFSATRSAVAAALDRGQLSQALLLLSDWYGDPSLSAQENAEVEKLLGQLAGSVIYSTEHRLEPPYMVQAGERLQDIATRYEVPWQLLAKINGITNPDELQTGQNLKVVRGPFSATIDLSQREVTLMLNRRYAGKFTVDVDPTTTVEEGHWAVNQKLLTPGNAAQHAASPVTPTEERSLILMNTSADTNQLVIIRGANVAAGASTDPVGRVIRLSSADVGDVFDILSLGSEITIRR